MGAILEIDVRPDVVGRFVFIGPGAMPVAGDGQRIRPEGQQIHEVNSAVQERSALDHAQMAALVDAAGQVGAVLAVAVPVEDEAERAHFADFSCADGIALIVFGRMLRQGSRRNAVLISHVLIATSVVQILFKLMLQGVDLSLIPDAIQLFLLIAVSVTVDPSLKRERALQRHVRDMVEREAAEEGVLGRDVEGKGYIELNFFNLFWVFVVCCILGLIIEVIYHMAVVDPGVYQDRAGMLFGPFSPIYGFGAVLMTVALNRFYKANPVIIFVVSAVIGGLFEAATSLFMELGFGAVAWDYSGSTIFGLFPDPIAVIFGGRTSTLFMCMWGALGFVWIKACLPWMLKLINLIPWKIRYSFTTLCAVLMLVNGVMTLEALDCWFERLSGIPQTTPVEQFYAEHYDNDYMAHRFESMTITPDDSARVDGAGRVDVAGADESVIEKDAAATFEDVA